MMANEKRLIDANALMDTVEGVNWYHIDKLGYLANGANSQDHTPIYKAEDIYNAIRNAPTVYAVEMPKGKPGDYIEWNNGAMRLPIYRISSVMICEGCMRYELKDFSPVVNHPCIERILSCDEAEAALAERR